MGEAKRRGTREERVEMAKETFRGQFAKMTSFDEMFGHGSHFMTPPGKKQLGFILCAIANEPDMFFSQRHIEKETCGAFVSEINKATVYPTFEAAHEIIHQFEMFDADICALLEDARGQKSFLLNMDLDD